MTATRADIDRFMSYVDVLPCGPGHWDRGMEADGPVVPLGGGHPVVVVARDALLKRVVQQHVNRARRATKKLMAERESQIAAGLVHEAFAAENSKRKER